MKFTEFIGVDISKNTFDVVLCRETTPETFTHQQFANTITGCKQLINWLKKEKTNFSESFFIMEHTGWYTLQLCCFLQEKHLAFALFSPAPRRLCI